MNKRRRHAAKARRRMITEIVRVEHRSYRDALSLWRGRNETANMFRNTGRQTHTIQTGHS